MTGTIWTIWFQLGCERGNLILTDLLAITPFSLPLFSLSIAHLIVHSHHVYTATGQFVKDGRSATDCFFCFPFILSAPSTLRATGHGGLDCTADSQQLPLVCFEHWGWYVLMVLFYFVLPFVSYFFFSFGTHWSSAITWTEDAIFYT